MERYIAGEISRVCLQVCLITIYFGKYGRRGFSKYLRRGGKTAKEESEWGGWVNEIEGRIFMSEGKGTDMGLWL